MKIASTGILNESSPQTERAFTTFPSVIVLPDSRVLAAYRVGSSKDSDDETIELRESRDFGVSWTQPRSPFPSFTEAGHLFSLKLVYFTLLSDRKLLATAMAVDRSAYPGQPLFNEIQGCLPMRILISESADLGLTWGEWRRVETPEDIGPPSLTSPLLRLPDGRLAMSLESNKSYLDASRWFQKVTYLYSSDEGKTWNNPTVVAQDPSGRIFNWDQRAAVSPDGAIATFTWVFDSQTGKYGNIWQRLSRDGGASWSEPKDIGFADQASRPAVFPDGRIVLAWVDRFGSRTIRARMALGVDQPFQPETEVILYHSLDFKDGKSGLSETLDEMSRWAYGLPFACPLPNGNALIVYYAGNAGGTSAYWAQTSLD